LHIDENDIEILNEKELNSFYI